MSAWIAILIGTVFLALFGVIAYKSAEYYFRNPSQNKNLIELDLFLRMIKKTKRGKPLADPKITVE